MCDEAGIFNCTSLGFIYIWLCSPQASNNNNNNISNNTDYDITEDITLLGILAKSINNIGDTKKYVKSVRNH